MSPSLPRSGSGSFSSVEPNWPDFIGKFLEDQDTFRNRAKFSTKKYHRGAEFPTQLLNGDAKNLATIQDLLGHGQITTTQRYCWVANLKVQRDYYKAMEVVLQRTQAQRGDAEEGEIVGPPETP